MRSFPVSLRVLASAAAVLLCVPMLSCGDAATSEGEQVARVDVTPTTLAMVTDETRSLTARVLDAGGNALGRQVFWSSSDASVATVSQAGLVTALAPGAVQLAASSGGRSALVQLTVSERAVALVRVTPSTSTLRLGSLAVLSAELLDASGATLRGRTITWSSASPSVAVVSPDGTVAGVSVGSATIAATAGNVTGTALVSIEPVPAASVVIAPATVSLLAGASRSLAATVFDSAGHPLTGRAVTWSTDAPTIANVSSSGVVLAIAPGVATITARSEGRSSTSRITVSAVPVATVTVSTATVTLAVAQTAAMVARVADASGAVLNGRSVAWTTSKASVATVDAATGVVTAVATGTATITATSEGKKGTSVVTVAIVPVASIQVTPTNLAMLEGESQRLKATMLDANGKVLSGRAVSWIGGAPGVATVDSTGLVTAVATGSAVIVASSEGARTSIPVTVAPVTVANVVVTPATRALESGRAVQLTAKITDIRGRVIAGKVATWTTNTPSRASVSTTGRVVGIALGAVTISASSDGVTGSSAVTVIPLKATFATVTPSSAPLFAGRTLPLKVQLADASNRPLTLTGRTMAWSSSAPAVATVDTAGVVTGVGAGVATITVSTDTASASATITVTEIPVASVVVTPATAAMSERTSLQLTATALDAQGGAIPGRAASTWRSDTPAVATVDATGVVSAIAPGSARLTATIDGYEGSATISVAALPVSSIGVAPAAPSVRVGAKLTLAATLYAPNPGIVLSPTGRTVTWSVQDASIATISSAGVLTGVRAGTTVVTVRALSPGQLSPAATNVVVTVLP